MKAFIFTALLVHAKPHNSNIKTFREPLYLGLDFGLAVWIYSYLQGLFICGCFKQTPLNFKFTTPEYIITGCNGTIPRLVNKAMQVVTHIFIGNNNKTVWGNLFTESTDMLRLTECRFKIKMFTLLSLILIGGKGVNLLFTPSINSFPHAVTTLHSGKAKSNLNSLLPINL